MTYAATRVRVTLGGPVAEEECRKHYRIHCPARKMSDDDLIEWLVIIAHDGKYSWGWIRFELRRRLKRQERIARSLHALNQKSPIQLTLAQWKQILEEEDDVD